MESNYIVLCVSTDINNEGYIKFLHSCGKNNIAVKTLGLHEKWKGGNMEAGPGGGHKINLLKEELSKMSDVDLNKLIIFTDSYDVIFESGVKEIVNKFDTMRNDRDNVVIFSCEKECWPNKEKERFFKKTEYGYNYLNSGGFIGKGNVILKLLEQEIYNNHDDQEYYTDIYIKSLNSKDNVNIILDNECNIFQTLNNALEDIYYNKYSKRLLNKRSQTTPCIIHANGPSCVKKVLHTYYDKFKNDMMYKGKTILS